MYLATEQEMLDGSLAATTLHITRT